MSRHVTVSLACLIDAVAKWWLAGLASFLGKVAGLVEPCPQPLDGVSRWPTKDDYDSDGVRLVSSQPQAGGYVRKEKQLGREQSW